MKGLVGVLIEWKTEKPGRYLNPNSFKSDYPKKEEIIKSIEQDIIKFTISKHRYQNRIQKKTLKIEEHINSIANLERKIKNLFKIVSEEGVCISGDSVSESSSSSSNNSDSDSHSC